MGIPHSRWLWFIHPGSAKCTLRMILKRDLMKWPILELLNLWLSLLTGFQVCIKQSNGRWHVCLDSKDLNKLSREAIIIRLPLSHKFKGSTAFSKLDARHGYCSVVLDEESSYLFTFHSPLGRFRFIRLPFGPCVSHDIFQKKMDFILEKCPRTVGIADDITVHGLRKNMMPICTTSC